VIASAPIHRTSAKPLPMPTPPIPALPTAQRPELPTLLVAAALALAAAVSLGLSRFSYALLLPPMRADLGWSYFTAGAINTVNAAGYLVGALLTPIAMRRFGARASLLAGGGASGALLLAHGGVTADAALYTLRALTGIANAAAFISGGLLAARLGSRAPVGAAAAPSAGLVLGVYYGGTGAGIVAAALLVPPLCAMAVAHAWQWAWAALGALALLATVAMALATRGLEPGRAGGRGANRADGTNGTNGVVGANAANVANATSRFDWRPMRAGLVAYLLFGIGYIGYMTFVVTMLKEQGLSAAAITAFYGLLGVAVMLSSRLWAGLLQRERGGRALALLNALLGAATLLPVLSTHPLAVFASGALFGGVMLSVVASTTALVRHNLPPDAWSGGIAAFTTVFAAGQVFGPVLTGWVADGALGLRGGLACSAALLLAGAAVACAQRALPLPGPAPGPMPESLRHER
jgi:MFS family permease